MIKQKIKVEIDMVLGSKFQAETSQNSITTFLMAWRMFYIKNHKKNKIEYKIEII